MNLDLLNVEQPPGLPTDEDEADLEQDRKSTSIGAETQTPDHSVSTAHAPKNSTPTADSARIATCGSGRCRTTRAIHAATSVPKSAIATNVSGSHLDP